MCSEFVFHVGKTCSWFQEVCAHRGSLLYIYPWNDVLRDFCVENIWFLLIFVHACFGIRWNVSPGGEEFFSSFNRKKKIFPHTAWYVSAAIGVAAFLLFLKRGVGFS